jgi:dihydropteroate synthase
MGILNITPDSFSDGGRFTTVEKAIGQAAHMVESGADIIDVGGESTRPGAQRVGDQEEIDRVMPVIEAIRQRFDTIVSIDTSKATVIDAAVAAGAGLINDVRALREDNALEAAAKTGLPICLMHMQGQPGTMQQAPEYQDVTREVCEFLQDRVSACVAAGIAADQIVIDPGFGFGKLLGHNLTLLNKLHALREIAPVLIGLSRKRMLGQILGDEHADRVTASVTAALLCIHRGASIVRVHDVKPMVHALKVNNAVTSAVP